MQGRLQPVTVTVAHDVNRRQSPSNKTSVDSLISASCGTLGGYVTHYMLESEDYCLNIVYNIMTLGTFIFETIQNPQNGSQCMRL